MMVDVADGDESTIVPLTKKVIEAVNLKKKPLKKD